MNGINDKIARKNMEKDAGDDSPILPSITEAGTYFAFIEFLTSFFGSVELFVGDLEPGGFFFFFFLGV